MWMSSRNADGVLPEIVVGEDPINHVESVINLPR
jgi:hypothetical protein